MVLKGFVKSYRFDVAAFCTKGSLSNLTQNAIGYTDYYYFWSQLNGRVDYSNNGISVLRIWVFFRIFNGK